MNDEAHHHHHDEKRSFVSSLVKVVVTWLFLAVSVVGLPLGSISFPFINFSDRSDERSWVSSVWHMFCCGIISLGLALIVLFLYWISQQSTEVNFAQ